MSYFKILKESLLANKDFNSIVEDTGTNKSPSSRDVADEILKRLDSAETEHDRILKKAEVHKVHNKEIEQLEKNLKRIRDMKNELKLAAVHAGQQGKVKFPAVRHGLFDKGFKSKDKHAQLKAVRETGKGLPGYKENKRKKLGNVEKKVEKVLAEPKGKLMGGKPGIDKVIPVTRVKLHNLNALGKTADSHIKKVAKENAKNKELLDPKEPDFLKSLGAGIHRMGTRPV